MKDNGLEMEWAWAHVEAMADGSLSRAERRRMRSCMHADPALGAAVERARRLRSELGRLGRSPVPAGLTRRLLAMPGRAHAGARLAWGVPAAAAAAGVTVAVAGLLVLGQTSRPPPEREAAVREFRLAMSYLQQSAAVTGDDVTRELTNGLHEALAVSRGAVLDPESQNGDQSDD